MNNPILGVTMGDPAGVGPEIIVRAGAEPEVQRTSRPVVIGAAATLEEACGAGEGSGGGSGRLGQLCDREGYGGGGEGCKDEPVGRLELWAVTMTHVFTPGGDIRQYVHQYRVGLGLTDYPE